jgi:signal transduction histidine kinase/ligand-binding sensor domain-containing protein
MGHDRLPHRIVRDVAQVVALCCILLAALLAAPPASALNPNLRIDQFRHTRWTLGDGAPGNIRAIAQGKDGFLWLGTSTGLYRFDGIRFDRILPDDDDPLRSLQVTALLVAKNGDLWVGYDYGGIGVLRAGHLRNANPAKPFGGVYRIVEGTDGAIWVAADGNGRIILSRRLNGQWSLLGPAQGVTGVQAGSIVALPDGSVQILAPTTPELASMPLRKAPGSSRFEPWALTLTTFADLARDREGNLWLADNRGLRRLDGRVGGSVPLAGVTTPFLERKLYVDRDGALWISGQDDGLVRVTLRDGRITRPLDRFAERDGLTGPVAMSLFEDREGNIWIGTESGLDRFSPSNVVQPRGAGPIVTGFVGGKRSERIFFGGMQGVFVMARGMTEPQLILSKPSLGVLCGDDRRLLAISMDDNTLLTLAPTGKVITVRDAGGPLLITCTLDTTGRFWASLKDVYRLVGDELRRVDAPWTAGKHGGNLAHLRADDRGGLIAGRSLEGVQRVRDGRGHWLWRAAQGRIGATNLFVPVGKRIYQGAQRGLGLYVAGRHFQLSERTYSFLAGITGIQASADGSVWLIGATGIYRLSISELDAAFRSPGRPLNYARFGYEEGFRARSNTLDTNDVVEDRTGRLWFATNRGLAWIDRDQINRNTVPPGVVILALRSGGARTTATGVPIRLPVGTKRVEIEYTALSLTDARANRYRYKLAGVDRDWVDAGSASEALYTNLGPGNYRFRVIAANNDGVWNRTGSTLIFRIAPAFYQTWWFAALSVIAAVFALWQLYRWRLRTIAASTRNRFEARLAERERIARELHDTLMQGFHGVLLRFQSVLSHVTPGSQAHRMLEGALNRADDVLVEGRDRVHDLREHLAPVDLLKSLIKKLDALVAPGMKLTISQEGGIWAVRSSVADEIALVVSEAVANAAKHAKATVVEVIIWFDFDKLTVVVEDNGIGIPLNIVRAGGRRGHYGLIGMRERADHLNGSISIGAGLTNGARICLVVPSRTAAFPA